MGKRGSKQTQQTCPVDPAGVPACGAGPGGRLAFVAREVVAAVRVRRARRQREQS